MLALKLGKIVEKGRGGGGNGKSLNMQFCSYTRYFNSLGQDYFPLSRSSRSYT